MGAKQPCKGSKSQLLVIPGMKTEPGRSERCQSARVRWGGLLKQKTTVGAGLRFDFSRFYLFLMRSAASGTRLWFAH